MRGKPAYIRVYEAIKRQIADEKYEVGQLIPTEAQLESMFNVSRITIRAAIELLCDEGYLTKTPGRGTEVLDYKTTQKLNLVTSFSETLLQKGHAVAYKSIDIACVDPPKFASAGLKLDPDSKVIKIERVVLADGRPIAVMINYLVPELVPGIESRKSEIKSLYAFLEDQYNIEIDHSIDTITAEAAGPREAELLEVPEGTALLVNHRITYTKARPFEIVLLKVVGSKYEFRVYLKGREGS